MMSVSCRRLASRAFNGLCLALVGLLAAAAYASGVHAQEAAGGSYTDDQAKRGESIYQDLCASCHKEDLTGGAGPSLTGGDFKNFWGKSPLFELFDRITGTMPATAPGTLSASQTVDVVAYILKVAKFPAGSTELPADADALKKIVLVK